MNKAPKPLYRKVNTKTHGVHHLKGWDASRDRNTKSGMQRSLKKNVRRGLDYTPLYMFLLSKVGRPWSEVHSEALSRLPKGDDILNNIFNRPEPYRILGTGESAYFSGMFIDDDGILRKVMPEIQNEDILPLCNCCTHTLNGEVLVRKFDPAMDRASILKLYR
jgi:hypothetical protein